jgi:3-methyladenine DNA glycosylase Mpg
MRERRHSHPDHNLTNGPGKLCIAMGIDRELDKADLLGDRVWLEDFESEAAQIAQAHASASTTRGMDRQTLALLDQEQQLRQQKVIISLP